LIQGFLLEAGLSRGDLSEAEWRVLRSLLPIDAANRGLGRPPEENRSIINGILWRLRCGTPWRDVPPKYGNWNTIYRRFRRWSEAGVWEAVSVIRTDLARRNIQAVIPGRSNRRIKIEHDKALYRERNHIERFFGRLKINRAIATRYDQLAESFLSMVHIAAARYWLKFVHAA
jgi:transposase